MIGHAETSSSTRRAVAIAIGLYLLAVVLRLGVLYEVHDHPTFDELHALDMRGNHEFALSILEGLRPTTFYKAPAYTYVMAGIYALTDTEPLYVRLVQIVLVSFVPVLTFLIGRFFFGDLVGAIAGLLAAVFWTFLYFSVELLDTELACLIYMLLAYLLLILDGRRLTTWLVCGLLLGLGAITRPNILAFAPVLAVTVFLVGWRRERRRAASLDASGCAGGTDVTAPGTKDAGPRPRPIARPLGHVVVLTVACCLAIAPVTLRNILVGGDWVLIGAYGGMNLYVANSPHSDSKDGPLLVDEDRFATPTTYDPNEPWARCCLNYYLAYRVAETELGRKPSPGEFSGVMGRMAWDFIRENPDWFARHALRRLCWLFNTHEFHSNRDFYHFRWNSWILLIASGLQFGMLCPPALIGLILALRRRDLRTASMAYYVGMLAALTLPAVLFIINARFRLPMVHLLMPFAAYGIVEIVGLLGSGVPTRRRLAIGVPLVGLALFCNLNVFDYWSSPKGHLRWAMVVACDKAGRDDLLPEAVAEFEAELEQNLKDLRPSNIAEVLRHSRPYTWLFDYYDRRDNCTKAYLYARRMIDNEPFDPKTWIRAFHLFLAEGNKTRARRVLDALPRYVPDPVRAELWLRFGQRFEDREALRRSERHFVKAVELNPGQPKLRAGLDAVRKLLAKQPGTTQSTTAPAAR